MSVHVTRCGPAADYGHVESDPRALVRDLRLHLGLAEGHLASLHRLLRELDDVLDRGRT